MSGGGKGAKTPKTPDYASLAAQQGSINQQTAQQLTQANRPNQYDAFGNSITWTQNQSPELLAAQKKLADYNQAVTENPHWAGDLIQQDRGKIQAEVDRLQGQSTWEQHQNLNPETKAAWEKYMADTSQATSKYGDILNGYLSKYSQSPEFTPEEIGKFSQRELKDFDPTSGKAVADALYGSVMDRGRKEQTREVDSLTTQLRNSGLVPGSEAYNRAMQNLMTSQNDANLLAGQNATLAGADEARQQYATYLAGQGQGFGQDLASYGANTGTTQLNNTNRFSAEQYNRNQPLQELAGLAGVASGNPYTPTYAGFSGATGYNPTDLVGAAQATYGAKQNAANASNSKKGGLLGAGASLGGSYLGSK